jgi:transposase
MITITEQHIGKYTYIYQSIGKWDSVKKICINNKIKIGKIDPVSKKVIFTQKFLEEANDSSEITEQIKTRYPYANLDIKENSEAIIKNKPLGNYPGEIISFGKTYFAYNIAKTTGLLLTLKNSFPTIWKEIFTTATFLLFENKALIECDDFVLDNLTYRVGSLSSQRTSELLFNIEREECNKFFKLWYECIREKEYVAFDATNISTYSEKNELSEYGKAKANPELRQINLCLLFGEKSRLPIYQSVYNGSINDVSTLLEIIKHFEVVVGTSEILTVNDKGFYSKKNIVDLINKTNVKFIIAVPFNNTDANNILDEFLEINKFSSSSTVISTNHESINGVCELRKWYGTHKLYTHVFYNCLKGMEAQIEFRDMLKSLRDSYNNDQLSEKERSNFERFFIINDKYPKHSKFHLIDNEEEKMNYLKHVGWLIMISNHTKKAQDAYDLYISKDCIEKAFREYKQNLQMDRFYTGNSKRVNNKAMIEFIALILNSHIHRVMKDKKLYNLFTRSQMFNKINRLRAFKDIDGIYYINTMTKEQKNILEAFEIPIPNRYIINNFIKNIIKY